MNGALLLPSPLFLSLCLAGMFFSPRSYAEDPIVAKVDGVAVFQSDVDEELGRFLQRLESYPPDQAKAMSRQAQRQVIEDLIGKHLLVNAARAAGIVVTDAEMNERLTVVIKSLAPNGAPESFLREAGISKEELSEDVRRNLLMNKLVEQITEDVAPPTEEQIAGFYEENKASFYREETVECRHVFFDLEGVTEDGPIDLKRQQAEAVRKMLLENPGLDFGRISSEKSDGPTAGNGGYLGFMGQNDFLPEFTKAAFAQEVGKIGQVVRTPLGFHIIKVESRSPARQPELPEIKDRLRDSMWQRKRGEVMRRKVDEWRRAAKIELLVPLDEEGLAPATGEAKLPN